MYFFYNINTYDGRSLLRSWGVVDCIEKRICRQRHKLEVTMFDGVVLAPTTTLDDGVINSDEMHMYIIVIVTISKG